MSYHLDTTYKREAEKRANQCRSSFNPKLLNAAWPKAPSVPTRHSHIKGILYSIYMVSAGKNTASTLQNVLDKSTIQSNLFLTYHDKHFVH